MCILTSSTCWAKQIFRKASSFYAWKKSVGTDLSSCSRKKKWVFMKLSVVVSIGLPFPQNCNCERIWFLWMWQFLPPLSSVPDMLVYIYTYYMALVPPDFRPRCRHVPSVLVSSASLLYVFYQPSNKCLETRKDWCECGCSKYMHIHSAISVL